MRVETRAKNASERAPIKTQAEDEGKCDFFGFSQKIAKSSRFN